MEPAAGRWTAWVYPEPEADGYSAQVPAPPGCDNRGKTLEEVQAKFRESAGEGAA